MHDSVRSFVAQYAPTLRGPVLEVGSCNVNGGVRDLFEGLDYLGCDVVWGDGVDVKYDGQHLPVLDASRATVLCLEVFEHCEDPMRLSAEIVRVLAPGGIALVTARGNGFPHHHPPDRWRFMPGTLAELFARHGLDAHETEDPQHDHPGALVRATKAKA